MVLDGPMNGPAFLAYVEQVLVPTRHTLYVYDGDPGRGREFVYFPLFVTFLRKVPLR